MPYNVDLHTHSQASPDGSLRLIDYRNMLELGALHCIAVTDHNTIAVAEQLQKELGKERIIIGEEVTTLQGEVIGLFLTNVIPAGLSLAKAVACIKEQGGLVYVPHPFETVRSGIAPAHLDEIASSVDIIEIHNGRAIFQNKGRDARIWATTHTVAGAASSDAHGISGWGRSYSILNEMPTRETLVDLLRSAHYRQQYVGTRGILYPKLNRIRKRGTHV